MTEIQTIEGGYLNNFHLTLEKKNDRAVPGLPRPPGFQILHSNMHQPSEQASLAQSVAR